MIGTIELLDEAHTRLNGESPPVPGGDVMLMITRGIVWPAAAIGRWGHFETICIEDLAGLCHVVGSVEACGTVHSLV